MDLMKIGTSGITASRMTFGAWGLGGGTAWGDVDEQGSIASIHRAYELGINMVDTAPVYGTGTSEQIVGKAIKGRRHDFIISTKCALQWRNNEGVKEYDRDGQTVYRNLSASSLRADLEDSLRRLDTDYIDILYTHRQPITTPVAEVMDTLLSFKKEGKIRAIGLSNGSPEILSEYLKYGPVDMVQEKYSLITQKPEAAYLPLCKERSVTFQAYSALERGLLTGKIGMDYVVPAGNSRNAISWYQPEQRKKVLAMLDECKPIANRLGCSLPVLMLAYVMAQAPHINVLCGIRKNEQLEDSIHAAELQLSAADMGAMRAAAAKIL